jgi:hypothetical protein
VNRALERAGAFGDRQELRGPERHQRADGLRHCRVAPDAVLQQRALAKVVARVDGLDEALAIADLDRALLDEVEGECGLAGVEEHVAGLQVHVAQGGVNAD